MIARSTDEEVNSVNNAVRQALEDKLGATFENRRICRARKCRNLQYRWQTLYMMRLEVPSGGRHSAGRVMLMLPEQGRGGAGQVGTRVSTVIFGEEIRNTRGRRCGED